MNREWSSQEWVAAYLEWFELPDTDWVDEPESMLPAQASADLARIDARSEAVLLWALRTESDCMHILRELLEAGDSAPERIRQTVQALEHAEQLLGELQRGQRMRPESVRVTEAF